MARKLFRFCSDYGRMGEVEGLFITDEEKVKAAYGTTVNFGEILGKHSNISVTLEPEQFEVMLDDEHLIPTLEALLGSSWCGYNPLDFLPDEE